jgi:hypothetical protein
MMNRVGGWREDGKVHATQAHEVEQSEVVRPPRKVTVEAPAAGTISRPSDLGLSQAPRRIDPLQSIGVVVVEEVGGDGEQSVTSRAQSASLTSLLVSSSLVQSLAFSFR